MVAFVVMAELVGAELILGAFLGGVLASLLSEPHDEKLRHKLDAIGFGFFVPLFFVYVGVQFNLNSFLENPAAWILLPILLVAAFGIKLISALVFRFAYSWRESLSGGMLLSARLSLIIAASAIGVRLGAITESTNAAIILIAALTAMFAPLGFNLLMAPGDEKKKRAMLVFGDSDLAFQVGKILLSHGDKVLFMETDPRSASRIREQGFEVASSNGSVASAMHSLGDTRVEAFLALKPDDQENLEACRVARVHGVEHLLSFVSQPIRIPDFRGLGVQTLTPSLHLSSLLALMARNPAMFTLITSPEDERDLREFTLNNSTLQGRKLMDLKFPADLLVLAIRRDDELIVPHGTTKLATGDHLTIIGNLDSLSELEHLLEM
jgi:Trk K+ transport system NAD-binding subunit